VNRRYVRTSTCRALGLGPNTGTLVATQVGTLGAYATVKFVPVL